MKLSIIIVHYNTTDLTAACLRSIFKYAPVVPYEVILVDNASAPSSIATLRSEFPETNILANLSNLGFSKACNVGIRSAKGEYICLLNSDTELNEDPWSVCLEAFQNSPGIGVVTCRLTYPDGKIQHNCQRFPSLTAELIEITRLHKLFSASGAAELLRGSFFDHERDLDGGWVWGTFFMFRKSDLNKLEEGKLSERFFMYGEDMEWCFQFRKAGLRTKFLASAGIIHHSGGSSAITSEEKTAGIIKNELEWLLSTKGKFYTWLFRKIRFLKYKSLRRKYPNLGELASYYRG